MKRTHFILLAIMAISLVACKERNTPSYNGSSSGTGGTNKTEVTTAGFEYNFIDYNILEIKDKSVGKEAIYDFGDGVKEVYSLPYNYIILHFYKALQTYKESATYTLTVQVTGTDGAIKKHSEQIVVKKTIPYITGIRFISVDVPYEYYRVKLLDDDIIATTWISMPYTQTMLYQSVLPATFKFNTPVLMNGLDNDEYYTLYIYHSPNGTGDGTQCLKQNISRVMFGAELPTITVKNNSGNTEVELLMEYK